jgi:hypothetical protein
LNTTHDHYLAFRAQISVLAAAIKAKNSFQVTERTVILYIVSSWARKGTYISGAKTRIFTSSSYIVCSGQTNNIGDKTLKNLENMDRRRIIPVFV